MHVRTGYHIVQTVNQSFLYWNLEWIWDWSSTERRPDGLLRRLDGCKLDRNFLTQWRVRREVYVIRTDDAWSDWRSDGMARRPDGWNSGQMGVRTGWLHRPDGWQGTEIFVVLSLLRVLWKWNPCLQHLYTHKWFCPNREWGQNTNTKDPISLTWNLCRIFITLNMNSLKLTESLIKSIITKNWFCPTKCSQLQTNKLPLWPFWNKNTWPV